MFLLMRTADNINNSSDNLSKLVRKLPRFQSTLNDNINNSNDNLGKLVRQLIRFRGYLVI
jgi:ABC-type transporter Mla subunit MlaD